MSQQLLGGNASTADYDYESGSGMDSFISRSIDEISWQSGLGTIYNTLSNLPIGTSPTTATPTNYDATQISGSQSGASTIGGATGGSAGSAGAGVTIDSTHNVITLSDGTNTRLILGQGSFS